MERENNSQLHEINGMCPLYPTTANPTKQYSSRPTTVGQSSMLLNSIP